MENVETRCKKTEVVIWLGQTSEIRRLCLKHEKNKQTKTSAFKGILQETCSISSVLMDHRMTIRDDNQR